MASRLLVHTPLIVGPYTLSKSYDSITRLNAGFITRLIAEAAQQGLTKLGEDFRQEAAERFLRQKLASKKGRVIIHPDAETVQKLTRKILNTLVVLDQFQMTCDFIRIARMSSVNRQLLLRDATKKDAKTPDKQVSKLAVIPELTGQEIAAQQKAMRDLLRNPTRLDPHLNYYMTPIETKNGTIQSLSMPADPSALIVAGWRDAREREKFDKDVPIGLFQRYDTIRFVALVQRLREVEQQDMDEGRSDGMPLIYGIGFLNLTFGPDGMPTRRVGMHPLHERFVTRAGLQPR
jgi:hypothetical protein